MIRIIGALMIIVGCGVAGLIVARTIAQRPKYLQNMSFALQLLETEIEYGRTSLAEAGQQIAAQTNPPVKGFFNIFSQNLHDTQGMSAAEAWEQALDVLLQAGMTKNDVEMIGQLGGILGRSDVQDQLKHINLLQKRLNSASDQAEFDRVRNERLWNYLGFCVGALVVLLLY